MLAQQTGKLPPQSLLRQRYLILRLIGQGGMGAVYQARDTAVAQRIVAVKQMSQAHLSRAEHDRAIARFQQEAALLSSLKHPHFPRFYELFFEQGYIYFIMDFIEGKTLSQLLSEAGGKPLSVSQVLAYAQQLCSVLAYLHQQHPPIIFRDLKPANIMVTEQGHIFLIDFGIARFFKAGQQQDTALFGSPGYSPPEQHGLFQTDPRSDLYSLGATLHACLAASDPAANKNPFVFPSLCSLNAQVPAELDELIHRLVALDPQQRPASALEVQKALLAINWQTAAPTEAITPALVSASALPGVYQPPNAAHASLAPLGQTQMVSVAFGQNIPASGDFQLPPSFQKAYRPSPQSIWSLAFLLLFGSLLTLMIGGSVFAFNVIDGSDHLVEFGLATLLLFVSIGAGLASRHLLPVGIVCLTEISTLCAALVFLVQAMPDLQTWLASLLEGALISQLLNQILAGGLIAASLASLLWAVRPFAWRERLLFASIFGAALVCGFLQYPLDDGDVAKHILLLIALVSLIQGALLAARIEYTRQVNNPRQPAV